jgi:hypothetical protein
VDEADASSGNTPLNLAGLHPELAGSVAARLLRAGAPIDRVSKSGDSALICACYKGNAHVAVLLLQKGAAVNTVGSGGKTALDWADQNGLADVAKAIRARCGYLGADAGAGLAQARALAKAIADKDVVGSLALIAAGADYNFVDERGEPALVAVARGGDDMYSVSTVLCTKMDKLGMDMGANKRVLDAALRQACDLAKRGERESLKDAADGFLSSSNTFKRDFEFGLTVELFALGINLNEKHKIAPMTVEMLVAHGADMEAGGSLLGALATCDYGHPEAEVLPVCARLIALGADVNGPVEHRGTVRTPLGHALYYHADDIAMLLLGHHADISKRGSDGKSPLDLAKSAGVLRCAVPKALARLKALGAM